MSKDGVGGLSPKERALKNEIKVCNDTLKEDSKDEQAYNLKGKALVKLAELTGDATQKSTYQQQALECYNKAITLNPNNAVYLVDRSKLHILMNNPELAAKDIIAAQEALSFDGALDMYVNNTIKDILKSESVKAEVEKLKKAEELSKPAAAQAASQPTAKAAAAPAVAQPELTPKEKEISKLQGEITTYDTFIKNKTTPAQNYANKATALLRIVELEGKDEGRYKEALECYDEAIKLDPNNGVYPLGRSKLHILMGNPSLAAKDIIEAYKAASKGNKDEFYIDDIVSGILASEAVKAEVQKLISAGGLPQGLAEVFSNMMQPAPKQAQAPAAKAEPEAAKPVAAPAVVDKAAIAPQPAPEAPKQEQPATKPAPAPAAAPAKTQIQSPPKAPITKNLQAIKWWDRKPEQAKQAKPAPEAAKPTSQQEQPAAKPAVAPQPAPEAAKPAVAPQPAPQAPLPKGSLKLPEGKIEFVEPIPKAPQQEQPAAPVLQQERLEEAIAILVKIKEDNLLALKIGADNAQRFKDGVGKLEREKTIGNLEEVNNIVNSDDFKNNLPNRTKAQSFIQLCKLAIDFVTGKVKKEEFALKTGAYVGEILGTVKKDTWVEKIKEQSKKANERGRS